MEKVIALLDVPVKEPQADEKPPRREPRMRGQRQLP